MKTSRNNCLLIFAAALSLSMSFSLVVAGDEAKKEVNVRPGWEENFEPDGEKNNIAFVDDWHVDGGVFWTPKTRFYLRSEESAKAQSVLVIESKKASAVFANNLSGKVNLKKTPLMRWRWRVKQLPPGADGREAGKDDQAVAIYLGTGTPLNQKSIAYRWETETPKGHWGKISYSGGLMQVWSLCIRNKEYQLGEWVVEERNLRDDFKERFGFVPENFAITIAGNSQYSQSDTLAEIDYIGFYPEKPDDIDKMRDTFDAGSGK